MVRLLSIMITLLLALTLTSCYTTFRAPHAAAERDGEAGGRVEILTAPLNPTIPTHLTDHYGWLYYYDSAWWLDAYENYESTGRGYAPDGYRQRFPNDPGYDGIFTGGNGATVVAPALGKGAADKADTTAPAREQSDRRSFSTGNQTNTQAGVNATPPPPQDTTPRSTTSTSAPENKSSGREQVKRK